MLGGIFNALAVAADSIRHFASGIRRLGDLAHASADQAEAWAGEHRISTIQADQAKIPDESSVKKSRKLS